MLFAAILIFLLPIDHAVDKMSVSHAKKIWKYILTLILFQKNDLGVSKVNPSTKKIRKVTLQCAPENPKNVCVSVCWSQNGCPLLTESAISWLLETSGQRVYRLF